ncbi:MAG TPA: hypothetical protein VKL99_16660 [Candidatus Angelobacter sp.]|nr:hypothetical protein [Candidatus Angelobacter sp.]
MLNYRRAARLVLVAAAPVLAMGQAEQVKPSPQQRPAAYSPSTAVVPAPSAGSTSSAPTSARPSNIAPVPTRPVMPQAVKPAVVAAVPELRPSQPALAQPAASAGSSPAPAGHDASAAVDYASGQLTVVADNATLGFVLKLIAGKTGAVVDLAPELQKEPVVARLGPGSVREVLTGLLDSPRIDYIVLGNGDGPGSLQCIVVRVRRSFGQVAMAAMHPAQSTQEGAEEGTTAAQAQMTQEQRMEEWKKSREQMLQAEIKQQAQDRENEKFQSPEQPVPQDKPQPQDNPPQL